MISHDIVFESGPEKRAEKIEFWIQAASRCRELNNFNSVCQVTGGLQNSSVYRLKKSWTYVSKPVSRSTLHPFLPLQRGTKMWKLSILDQKSVVTNSCAK